MAFSFFWSLSDWDHNEAALEISVLQKRMPVQNCNFYMSYWFKDLIQVLKAVVRISKHKSRSDGVWDTCPKMLLSRLVYTLFMASSLDFLHFFFLEASLDSVLRRADLGAEPSADGLDLVEFDKENMQICENQSEQTCVHATLLQI